MSLALEADHLCKRFGALRAVDDLCLSVDEGTVYGFVGPNGAGKTTTIRMLLGLAKPSSGTARIFGRDVRRDFKRAILPVGAMVEGPAFYPFLTARRNLQLFAGISAGADARRVEEVIARVGLLRRADEKVAGYSHGMRQRLGMALALLERPRLLVLDEPTNGLDPQGTREVRDLLRGIRAAGETTIFLSSHLLAELEQVCDRVAILSRGRLLREGRLAELLGGDAGRVEVAFAGGDEERAGDWLRRERGVAARRIASGRLELRAGARDPAELNRALVEAGFRVVEFAPRRRSLEDLFVELTGEGAEIH